MRRIINFKSILLIISLLLITNCSNNSAMKPEDFKGKEPRLIIEEYLSGNVKAWGVLQNRQWQITKIDENNYEGTAGDVVGKAKGYSYGPAFKFEYVLLVPVKGKEMKITFDDWIFKQDDPVAINRATMTKFGIKVAELTVVFLSLIHISEPTRPY